MDKYVRPQTAGSRGYSHDILRRFSGDAMLQDPHWGTYVFDDFTRGVGAGYTKTNLNSGTAAFAATAGRGGQATLDVGATTNNHGGQVQLGAGMFKVETGKSFAWEALLKLTGLSTPPKALVGLASADSSLLGATGGEDAVDFIGFYAAGGDLNLDFLVVDNGTQTGSEETVGAVANDKWIKLGLFCDRGRHFVPFIDGVELTDKIITPAASGRPELWMMPSFALVGSGTTQPTMVIDWHMGMSNDISPIQ